MSRKIKLYGAVAGILALSIAGLSVVRALSSMDSNIVTVTTKSATVGYLGQCTPISTSTISIAWTGSFTPPATALLYGSNTQSGASAATTPLTTAPASGSYQDSNLAPGTQRWYRVDTKFSDSPVLKGGTFTCTTNSISSDTPTKLGIFANSPSVLFFNWKDNATSTGSYSFEVQRIRVTPETPSSTATSSPFTANSVSFAWAVEGKSTPYETVIERSTSTDSAIRFNTKKDPKDLSFASFQTGQWNDPLTTEKYHSFSYTDTTAEDATAYYYRLKTCSLLQVGDLYADPITGVEQFNSDSTKPSPACSVYKPLDSGLLVRTPPAAPTDLVATASSTSVINLRWVNHSVNASGYEIERSKNSSTDFQPLTKVDKNTNSYRDANLEAGTLYYYRIRSYKDFGGGITLFSTPYVQWTTANTHTYFVVNASVASNDGAQGTVDSSPSGISCSSSCSASFPWGTSVSLSATPANADSVFDHWSDGCSGTSCQVSANATVIANFVNPCTGVTCNPYCVGDTYYSGGYCSGGSCAYSSSQKSTFCSYTPPTSCTTSANCTPYCGGANNFTYFYNPTCVITPPATTGTCNYASSTPNSPSCGYLGAESSHASNIALETKSSFPRISLMATISDAAKDVGNTIWGGIRLTWDTLVDGVNQLASLFRKQIPVAEGQSGSIDYDKYFSQTKLNNVPTPSFKDAELRADTVYLYRVRVVYGGGKTSEWSAMIAGKTLGESGVNKIQGVAGVCINNSYCQQVITEVQKYQRQYPDPNDPTKTLTEYSELQCRTNADCRNVGRSSQIFEEQ